ncbi:MAG: spore coat protein [Spirochaetaceae bacterium]|nr:MAG: spore coat protein [Spirochaetaceae bacterium]
MGTYIIAEIGTAHAGDLVLAQELIHAAHESGADCAKFQCVIASEIVHELSGIIDLPGGPTPIYERFMALERDGEFYAALQAICNTVGIDFLCSVFGAESARMIRALDPRAIKLASPELNHAALLEQINGFGLPVIASTGVSRLSDIEYAMSMLDDVDVTLLHCLTSYPAPEDEYNLRVIPNLSALFGVPVGVSDHSTEPELVPALAVALGASVVEKHFTLDRSRPGLDDPIALEPVDFTLMAATIRRVETLIGDDPVDGRRRVDEELRTEFGADRVERVLGDGVKRLAPAERSLYATTRRSLLATRDLPAGTTIGDGDIAALRAERLAPGLEPRFCDIVVGARLLSDVPSGHGIRWEHLVEHPAQAVASPTKRRSTV